MCNRCTIDLHCVEVSRNIVVVNRWFAVIFTCFDCLHFGHVAKLPSFTGFIKVDAHVRYFYSSFIYYGYHATRNSVIGKIMAHNYEECAGCPFLSCNMQHVSLSSGLSNLYDAKAILYFIILLALRDLTISLGCSV